jgi:PKD repeat protein
MRAMVSSRGMVILATALLVLSLLAVPTFAGNTVSVTGEISSVPAPVAAFTGSPLSGSAPLTVAFTDQSTGSITAWAWDFDNNGVVDSTTKNATFTYTAAGTYTVNLTVTGPGGSDDEVKTNYITVNVLDANFSATPRTGNYPLSVKFTDLSTGSPTSWKWDFNSDGRIDSTKKIPTYKYLTSGVYTVTLTVANTLGSDTEVKVGYITVTGPTPPPPVAAFTANKTSGNSPLAVKFTDQSTGNPTSWAWDFNNDGVIDSTARDPVYNFVTAGKYTVKLIASNDGGSNSLTKVDYITVNPVVAKFSANKTSGNSPLSVKFTDSSTGAPTAWAWDFNNDGTTDSTDRNPVYTFVTAGKYTVKLTASNDGGNNSVTKVDYITVNPVVAKFSANKTSGNSPLSVKFTDSSTGAPTAWAWDFDSDGRIDSNQKNPVYVYPVPGKYTVTLTASNAGSTNTLVKVNYITVKGAAPPPPVADFVGEPTSGSAPHTAQFTDTSTGYPTAWAWDVDNDGITDSTKRDPAWTYTAPGTYTVKLTVSNTGGNNTLTKTGYITVTGGIVATPCDGFGGCQVDETSDKAWFTTGRADPTNWDLAIWRDHESTPRVTRNYEFANCGTPVPFTVTYVPATGMITYTVAGNTLTDGYDTLKAYEYVVVFAKGINDGTNWADVHLTGLNLNGQPLPDLHADRSLKGLNIPIGDGAQTNGFTLTGSVQICYQGNVPQERKAFHVFAMKAHQSSAG